MHILLRIRAIHHPVSAPRIVRTPIPLRRCAKDKELMTTRIFFANSYRLYLVKIIPTQSRTYQLKFVEPCLTADHESSKRGFRLLKCRWKPMSCPKEEVNMLSADVVNSGFTICCRISKKRWASPGARSS